MLFYPLWQRAAAGTLHGWRKTMQGRLAEIIILDQFSRNLFRNSPQAYAQDLAALCLAQEAITRPGFAAMTPRRTPIHADALYAQRKRGAARPRRRRIQTNTPPAHRWISSSNTRPSSTASAATPHRNAVLGRESTPEELKFLAAEGRGF